MVLEIANSGWMRRNKWSELAEQPFHPERIYYYNCIHFKLVPQPAFILDITEHWPAKAASIEAYQSQFVTGRSTEPPSFLERLREEAAFWRKAIGVRYGEPFASKEPIGMKSLDSRI